MTHGYDPQNKPLTCSIYFDFNPNPPIMGALPALQAHENPISRYKCVPTGCDGWQIIMREDEMTLFILAERKHVAQTGFMWLRR